VAIAIAVLLALATLSTRPAEAAGGTADSLTVDDVVHAWEELRYDDALEMAGSLLTGRGNLSLDQLVELHKVIGFVTFSDGRLNEAENSFRSALSIEPDLQLDSLYVSPKILDFFRDVRAQFLTEAPEPGARDIRYLLVEDKRPAAALRSLLMPGWGQIYKGEERKGVILLGTAGGAALGALLTHLAMNNAHDRYLEATDPDLVASRYGRYNDLYRVRNNLLLAAAATWAWSYLDAAFREAPDRRLLSRAASRIDLSARPARAVAATRLYVSLSPR